MKNQSFIYGAMGLLGGILIGIFMSRYVVNTNNSSMMQMMGMRTNMMNTGQPTCSMTQSATIDQHFIEQMIPHHEDAVTMANMALKKAQKTETKTLAKNIIAAQTKEINQMKEWYKNWYGKDLPTGDEVMDQHGMMGSGGMHMGMMGNEMDIKKLENATNFDKAFIEEMIPHHQMAVMMASMLKKGTQREEMKKLADDIISTQTDEIDQMRKWYKDWE